MGFSCVSWGKEASFSLQRSGGVLLKPPHEKGRSRDPGCSPQLQNCCHGRETWNITSWKENTRGGCHLNVIIQPRLSIHTPDSSRKNQQFMSVLNHMEWCKMSAVMTALTVPSGASQILKDIWTLLSGAHRLNQRRKATLKAGSKAYSQLITRICRIHHEYSCFFYSWWSSPAVFTLSSAISRYHVFRWLVSMSSAHWIFVSVSILKSNRMKYNCCTSDDLKNPDSLFLYNFRHIRDELMPGALFGWLPAKVMAASCPPHSSSHTTF